MIKSLNKSDILVTPFEAHKTWEINNLEPSDLILWTSQSIDSHGNTLLLTGFISSTYIDYGDNSPTYPITNSLSSLALQQQTSEFISYERGIYDATLQYPTASFYPSYPYTNVDGTYMNVVYAANKHLFYNEYDNFTKTFGMESADLAQTNRTLTPAMDVFIIPQSKFGQKIVPNSVKIIDTSLDKEYTLIDDGNCNLIFSGSVYSKYQINNLNITCSDSYTN